MKKYTIENRKLGNILCTRKGVSKKYSQNKTFLGEGMKPCQYGIKYATKWVKYLKETDNKDWELYEVEELQ